ncbi:c-type cytochrome [Azohydromonas caseinilytica]|uniref:Cytochrome C n=1 Tax=Azohydromonas caseinilytica TaxID=2728836 RepID=A0A848F6M9_9BURK|nr:c-type cytochrome [Azohydromonas caseinilytica]NML15234.1 cytochrome C [Azohydromonas caseinilytica]
MRSLLIATAAATAALLSAPAFADADAALNKAGCMACHAKDKKLVGPAFKDIAVKYKGQDAVAQLTAKVRKGGAGSFGPIPMPPHDAAKIGDADLQAVVEQILKS